MSFAGLGFLAFYTAGKLHLFDERGHTGKAWLALTPFIAAALVAISRTMDYRHHWQDVLVGSLLGTVMSFFAYRQYYPKLSDELSHRPFEPRVRKQQQMEALELQRRPSRPGVTRRYTDTYVDVEAGPSESPHRPSRSETLKRPGPGPLHDVWRQGEEDDELEEVEPHP